MATNRKDNRNGTNSNSRPTHTVFQVSEQKDGNKRWNAVGAAWPHKDGKGFNIRLEAVPVPFDGNLTIRERTAKDSEGQ